MKTVVILLVAVMAPFLGMLIALRVLWAAFTAQDRAWLILIALDDLINVATNGALGQTISHRAAVARSEGRRWGCTLCRWLDQVKRGHCDEALTDATQNLKP